jgi:prepilin-type processing-associated H-X9-DG protein
VREAAARASCQNNMKQIGLATNNYHDNYNRLPLGGSTSQTAPMYWCAQFWLLPFIEQNNLFTAAGGGNPTNASPLAIGANNGANVPIKTYLCPARNRFGFANGNTGSSPNIWCPLTDYALNATVGPFGNGSGTPAGNNNGYPGNANLTLGTITTLNGTSNTIYIGEKCISVSYYTNNVSSGWDEGIYTGGYGGEQRTSNALDPDVVAGESNDWGSAHTAGAMFVFLDGHVQMLGWSNSGTSAFSAALNWQNTSVFQLQ